MIYGLIPAAGHSRRMGRVKLALPLGGRSVLERVVSSLKQSGVAEVLVVVGPHVTELVPLAESAGAHVLLLSEETPDMRATVERGLQWLQDRFHPNDDDAWLLVPGDHPTLEVGVVQRLVQAWSNNSAASIFIPTYRGKRGHPTLIRWRHVPAICDYPSHLGLNVYLREHADETLEVPVDAAGVVCDLDTPEDYERLVENTEGLTG